MWGFLSGIHEAPLAAVPETEYNHDTGFAHQGRPMNDWFDPSWCSLHLWLTPPLWSQVPL